MLIGKAKEWVAPYVGAWIETFPTFNVFRPAAVAPYVGAWIETNSFSGNLTKDMSHPTWVRGLKLVGNICCQRAPPRRTLRGCVD